MSLRERVVATLLLRPARRGRLFTGSSLTSRAGLKINPLDLLIRRLLKLVLRQKRSLARRRERGMCEWYSNDTSMLVGDSVHARERSGDPENQSRSARVDEYPLVRSFVEDQINAINQLSTALLYTVPPSPLSLLRRS